MKIKYYLTAAIATISLAVLPALVTGCSNSPSPAVPDQSSTGPAASNPHTPQSPAAMHAAEDKIKSDPRLSPAQKEIMLDEAGHYTAPAQQSAPGQ